jgi:hypothetical protein
MARSSKWMEQCPLAPAIFQLTLNAAPCSGWSFGDFGTPLKHAAVITQKLLSVPLITGLEIHDLRRHERFESSRHVSVLAGRRYEVRLPHLRRMDPPKCACRCAHA